MLSADVEKLWELQTVLSQLADREKAMSVKPEAFAAVDREYQASNEEMERLNQSLETLGKERRRVEGELSDQQELLKKYQGQLMQVKNQQQYAAAWKEIDAARKHVKELEESKRIIEQHIGVPVLHFAYPGGQFTLRDVEALERAGYRFGYTACPHQDVRHPTLTIERLLLWQGSSVDGDGQFSPAILRCQVHDLWPPARSCDRVHYV